MCVLPRYQYSQHHLQGREDQTINSITELPIQSNFKHTSCTSSAKRAEVHSELLTDGPLHFDAHRQFPGNLHHRVRVWFTH